jgi:hypothetical protein
MGRSWYRVHLQKAHTPGVANTDGFSVGDFLFGKRHAFARLVEIVYRGKATAEEIRRMAELDGLAGQWRDHARLMLQQGIAGI